VNGVSDRWLLTGDIGATKTAFAIFPLLEDGAPAAAEATFKSGEFETFEAVLETFLSTHPIAPERAVIAVAGPVLDQCAQVTNLPWQIEADTIEARFDIDHVDLINDIEALAWAIPQVDAEKLHVLHAGQGRPGGAIAILAPGTGCGEAFLVWNGSQYIAYPTEAGHADFASSNPDHIELLCYLRNHLDQVFVESFCSGIGLPNIYRFLRDERGLEEEPWLADRLQDAADATPIISEAAIGGTSPLCVKTLEWFVSVLAAEARSFAMRILATGGLFLGGGIPPRILPFLSDGRFLEEFHRGGPFSDVLADIPISVILDSRVALDGSARRGRAG